MQKTKANIGEKPSFGVVAPKPVPKAERNFRHGHRKRLKKRFFAGGGDAMADYEILELVLFLAHKRKDMKPLAHRLLAEFGSFHAVLCAERAELLRYEGVGDALVDTLKTVEAASQRIACSKLRAQKSIHSWKHLVEYCRTTMAQRQSEEFRVLFLNRKKNLISDEVMAKGTVDQVAVYPREVMRRALQLNASALILVHNHPSGDPTPSEADINMTGQIAQAASFLRMRLHDHLILGGDRVISLHDLGYC